MNNKQQTFEIEKNSKVGFVLGALLLAALAGGVGSAHAQGIGITITPPVVVVPPVVVAPAVVIQDDYVYYPSYGIYFNSHRHQYAHLVDGAWVWQPAPQGVSAEVLLASPSVKMDWHDSPEKHHAETLKKYPKNWRPAEGQHDQKENIKESAPDGDKSRDKH